MSAFRFNFEHSDSYNSDDNDSDITDLNEAICEDPSKYQKLGNGKKSGKPYTDRNVTKRRKRPAVVFDSSESEDEIDLDNVPSARLPLKWVGARSLALSNGSRVLVYEGLVDQTKHGVSRNISVSGRSLDGEAFVLLNKCLIILHMMCGDNHIEYREWNAVNNMAHNIIPERNHRGIDIKFPGLWRKYKTNLARSNRDVSWYRLYQALQALGTEFPACKENAHKLIRKIYKLIVLQPKKPMSQVLERAKSLSTKPGKLELVGCRYEFC